VVTPGNAIQGKHDTMIDLCADGIGATVAAFAVAFTAGDRATSGGNDG
jgi:hypothetical protein